MEHQGDNQMTAEAANTPTEWRKCGKEDTADDGPAESFVGIYNGTSATFGSIAQRDALHERLVEIARNTEHWNHLTARSQDAVSATFQSICDLLTSAPRKKRAA